MSVDALRWAWSQDVDVEVHPVRRYVVAVNPIRQYVLLCMANDADERGLCRSSPATVADRYSTHRHALDVRDVELEVAELVADGWLIPVGEHVYRFPFASPVQLVTA